MDICTHIIYAYVGETLIRTGVSKRKIDEKVDGGKTEKLFMYALSSPEHGFVKESKHTRKYHGQIAKLEHTK